LRANGATKLITNHKEKAWEVGIWTKIENKKKTEKKIHKNLQNLKEVEKNCP